MRFGSFVFSISADPNADQEVIDQTLREIEIAEEVGFDAVWLTEHHFDGAVAYADPVVFGAAVAARTKKIGIGLAVQVLPLANPLRVAEEAAIVDHISEGRLLFGVGRSSFIESYNGYNVDYGESRARFLESLEVIQRAWLNEDFSYHGEFGVGRGRPNADVAGSIYGKVIVCS